MGIGSFCGDGFMRRREFKSNAAGTQYSDHHAKLRHFVSQKSLQNLRPLNFNTLCTRFVVLLVRNVAKRCTSLILGRKVNSVVSVHRDP
jgi:hypothetical protein